MKKNALTKKQIALIVWVGILSAYFLFWLIYDLVNLFSNFSAFIASFQYRESRNNVILSILCLISTILLVTICIMSLLLYLKRLDKMLKPLFLLLWIGLGVICYGLLLFSNINTLISNHALFERLSVEWGEWFIQENQSLINSVLTRNILSIIMNTALFATFIFMTIIRIKPNRRLNQPSE